MFQKLSSSREMKSLLCHSRCCDTARTPLPLENVPKVLSGFDKGAAALSLHHICHLAPRTSRAGVQYKAWTWALETQHAEFRELMFVMVIAECIDLCILMVPQVLNVDWMGTWLLKMALCDGSVGLKQ